MNKDSNKTLVDNKKSSSPIAFSMTNPYFCTLILKLKEYQLIH